jgi:hypothetical protein
MKENLSRYTMQAPRFEYGFYSFLTSGLSGQRHASVALYPRGKDPRYPLDRRLVGLRASLDTEARGQSKKMFIKHFHYGRVH